MRFSYLYMVIMAARLVVPNRTIARWQRMADPAPHGENNY